MRAWQITRHGEPEEVLELRELPSPAPGPGQVRIRVAAAALNFADELLCRGRYQLKPEIPFTPGMEVCGVVDACGAGATLAPGRRVMAHTALPHGGLAEHALAHERDVYVIPPSLPDVHAAGFLIPYQTAHLALHRRGGIRAGDSLLVHAGAGGVGSAAIQLGRAAGARVFATAGGAEKVALCEKLGAELAIDYRSEDFVAAVNAATDGRGVDLVYDPVGGDIFDRSRKCIAWEGRILVVGFAGGRIADLPTNHAFIKNYSVVGVYIGEYNLRDRDYLLDATRELVDLHASGQLEPLIGARLTLEEVPRAIRDLSSRRSVGKLVIDIDEARVGSTASSARTQP
ncbi:MAG: NADPH:quinone oxidoreductase family protein [Deltaproteobacteria bacterium]|nr:NADPH:quinone oxidoreductase family protein [Deltaproteobacteria bacterium]